MGTGKNLAEATLEKISAMENRLSGTLKPVTPRREFISGLGQRIQTGGRASFVNPAPNWQILAMVIAAFVSMAVFIAMLTRALVLLAGKRKTA